MFYNAFGGGRERLVYMGVYFSADARKACRGPVRGCRLVHRHCGDVFSVGRLYDV